MSLCSAQAVRQIGGWGFTYIVKADGTVTIWWWGVAPVNSQTAAIGQDRKVPTQITSGW